MNALRDYELKPSTPNAQGLCTFTLVVRRTGLEVAHIDEPCTLEVALEAARDYVENMPPAVDPDQPIVTNAPGWGDWVWLKQPQGK